MVRNKVIKRISPNDINNESPKKLFIPAHKEPHICGSRKNEENNIDISNNINNKNDDQNSFKPAFNCSNTPGEKQYTKRNRRFIRTTDKNKWKREKKRIRKSNEGMKQY
jgi:hypothetical protein